MCIKSDINYIQKSLLSRLSVKKGSTMFIIIEAITRQAVTANAFKVSQKNATLATKADVTASTISRNLKKIKEKCSDLITIEQNRNIEEKFAALVFTFIPQEGQTEVSNGEKTEEIKVTNVSDDLAEIPSKDSLILNPLELCSNQNKDLIHSVSVNSNVQQEKIIHEVYLEYAKQGINKALFHKVLSEVKNKKGIKNLKAYLRGVMRNVTNHIQYRNGTRTYTNVNLQTFYNILSNGLEDSKRH